MKTKALVVTALILSLGFAAAALAQFPPDDALKAKRLAELDSKLNRRIIFEVATNPREFIDKPFTTIGPADLRHDRSGGGQDSQSDGLISFELKDATGRCHVFCGEGRHSRHRAEGKCRGG